MKNPFDIRPIFAPERMETNRKLVVYVGYNTDGAHGYFIVDEGVDSNQDGMEILEFHPKTSEDTYKQVINRIRELTAG